MKLPAGGQLLANNIRQHYLQFGGPGPLVVIVPGIVSPAILWAHVGERMASSSDCVILDMRGRGLSESGSHLDYGIDSCAADLSGFVEALNRGPAIVVGHSMGARVGLRAAARAPDLFHSLVLVDPPTSGPGRRAYPIPIDRTLNLLHAAQRGEALSFLRSSTAAAWPEDLERLRAEWLPTCDVRAVHAAYADFHQQDMFADLAAARIPVSLICAGNGGVVSEHDVAEMIELCPQLHAVRIPGVGHQMQAEDFEAFRRVLFEVLRRHHPAFERDLT